MDRTDEDRAGDWAVHNAGSGPSRRVRYQLCRLLGHRKATVDLSWWERTEASAWIVRFHYGGASGCRRCRALDPFDLYWPRSHQTMWVDNLTAIFP